MESHATSASDRIAVLTEAIDLLTGSLDPQQLADGMARLWVPRVADFCVIDEYLVDGRRKVLAVAHVDPEMEVVVRELVTGYPRTTEDVKHPGRPSIETRGYVRMDMTPEALERHLEGRPAHQQAAIRRLAPTCYVGVKLEARGRTVGSQLLGMSVSGRVFTDEDAEFVRQIAARTAAAVETARLHQDLAASEQRFRTLVQDGPMATLVSTLREGRILLASAQFEAQTGYARDEAIGRTVQELGLWAEPAEMMKIRGRLAAGETIRNVEIKGRNRAGELCPLLASFSLVEYGGEPCVVAMAHDLRELKRLEEQLWQARKLDALGRLAGAVAHDFNNALTKIIGYLEMLRAKAPAGELRGYAEHGHRTAVGAAALSRQMLAFSQRQVLSPRILDLNGVVEEVELLRQLIGEGSELVIEREAAPLHVMADPVQLEQVLVNLVLNARDAMPDGGRLTLRVRADGDAALLIVSDTGCGMDAAVKARLFEPFHTTKPGGSGLGLASVHGAVTQSGGTIAVESEPGRGTTFRVRFPRAAVTAVTAGTVGAVGALGALRGTRARARTEPGDEDDAAFAGTGTVLLVEDDEDLRTVVALLLGALGFEVLDARNGRAALKLAEGHNGSIRLLLTDVVMPHMGGPELADRLTAVHPELRVLFMSGFTGDASAALAARKTAVLLRKPFTREELLARLREVLG